jgi:tellurite resistance protein
MDDLDYLCERCASAGVSAVIDELHERDQIEALAAACTKRAQFDAEHGDTERAQRLVAAVQYLNYLAFPYD